MREPTNFALLNFFSVFGGGFLWVFGVSRICALSPYTEKKQISTKNNRFSLCARLNDFLVSASTRNILFLRKVILKFPYSPNQKFFSVSMNLKLYYKQKISRPPEISVCKSLPKLIKNKLSCPPIKKKTVTLGNKQHCTVVFMLEVSSYFFNLGVH